MALVLRWESRTVERFRAVTEVGSPCEASVVVRVAGKLHEQKVSA